MLSKNYSVARVVQYTAADIGKSERHIERKNESYENMNVDLSRTPLNVHFRGCGELTYNARLDELVAAGAVSLRGLKKDAKVFDEMIFTRQRRLHFFQSGLRNCNFLYAVDGFTVHKTGRLHPVFHRIGNVIDIAQARFNVLALCAGRIEVDRIVVDDALYIARLPEFQYLLDAKFETVRVMTVNNGNNQFLNRHAGNVFMPKKSHDKKERFDTNPRIHFDLCEI